MTEREGLTGFVEDAVDHGTTTAEEIHQEIAALPVTLLEGLGLAGDTLTEFRRVQTDSITAVYALIRSVNHKVAGFARDLLAVEPPEAR
jgi:hypothetical protein